MFVTFRGRPGREGRCLEAIGPGCLCPTGKPCKLTEKSWQNSLTCGNFCAILGCYSRSKNCPHPTHLSPGGNCPSGHRRVRVCEWKPESSRCGIQLDTMERTRAFYRLPPHSFMQHSQPALWAKLFALGGSPRALESSSLCNKTKSASCGSVPTTTVSGSRVQIHKDIHSFDRDLARVCCMPGTV